MLFFNLDSYFLFKLKGYFLYFTPIVHSMLKLTIHFRLVLIIYWFISLHTCCCQKSKSKSKVKTAITKISSKFILFSHDKLCSLGVKQQPLTYMFYILSQFIARFNLFFLRFLYALLNCSDRVVFLVFHFY